jgi:hypothetical protein
MFSVNGQLIKRRAAWIAVVYSFAVSKTLKQTFKLPLLTLLLVSSVAF